MKKWTYAEIEKNRKNMSLQEIADALKSIFPKHIKKISDKMRDRIPLTEEEEQALSDWEKSPESGPVGSFMGGLRDE